MSVINTATNAVVGTLGVGAGPRGIMITPDGSHAYVANTTDGTVSVIEIDTFPTIATTTVPDATAGGAYGPAHIDVSGSGPPDLALTAGALPPGLTLDPATGDITGTPTAAGTCTFTLTASSSVSGIPSSVTQDYTIEVAAAAPTAPVSLAAQLAGDVIDLGWTPPAFDGGTPVTGYRIERSINGGGFAELVADTASSGTTYTDNAIVAGTTYTYRVYALNAAGPSAASNEAAVAVAPVATTTTTTTTTTEPPTTAPPTTPPTAPAATMPPPIEPVPGLPKPAPTPRRR